MLLTALLFIIVLSLLVFVHELGHFLMARKMGMRVDEFGFGFPPRLWGIKRGGTIYSINWIPLGGFVKIKGESGEDRTDADSFASKPAWQRFFVLVAGVTMNWLLAASLLSGTYMVGAPSVTDGELPAGARVRDPVVRVMSVLPESPAYRAGIVSGDAVLSVNGQAFQEAELARQFITERSGEGVILVLQRENKEAYQAELVAEQIPGVETKAVGVRLVTTALVSYPPHLAVVYGVVATATTTRDILFAFGGLLRDLVLTGRVSSDLSGPVGIAVMTGQAAALGFVHLLQFTALLSINLAIINILPFPALDGGRVFFIAMEKLRRRTVSQYAETIAHNIGFLLLMGLVLIVTYRDVVRFGGQILGTVKSLFGA